MPPRTPVERCPRSSSRAACDRRGLRRRAWALTVLGRPDFDDAWELAGDGTPGYTWSNHNPLAALGLYPDRRIDYILPAWPRAGGVGHPTRCELLGDTPTPEQDQLSNHYGILADLRY
jgi:hypothetical protein